MPKQRWASKPYTRQGFPGSRQTPFRPGAGKGKRRSSPATFHARRRRLHQERLRLLLVGALILAGLFWWKWPLIQQGGGWMQAHLAPFSLACGACLALGCLIFGGSAFLLLRQWQQTRHQQALRLLYAQRHTLRSLQAMPPEAFERYVGGLFEREGYQVALTPRSGDEGIDLWLTRPDGQRLPVQCKRYADEHPVGSSILQSFSGAMRKALALEGYVVTTSRYTPAAKAWAASEGITLIDGAALLAWQQRLFPTAEDATAAPGGQTALKWPERTRTP